MRFDEFMRWALYDERIGYYRNGRDPFGTNGDYFTAAQFQPLFGEIIASEARFLEPDQPVWEFGPGRREMAHAFDSQYTGMEIGDPLPSDLSGFIFANEFFDALPVRAGTKRNGVCYEQEVKCVAGRWTFTRGERLDNEAQLYVNKYWPNVPEDGSFEIGFEALEQIASIATRMKRGHALIIDYGYTTPETIRFPRGTLMSYHRHAASNHVLDDPGSRDITAHVAFDALCDHARANGFEVQRFETLASLVLRVLERDAVPIRDAQQLKGILVGLGETFRCLTLQRVQKQKRPRFLGAE